MRLAILGKGKMGQILSEVAERQGHEVVAHVGRPNPSFWDDLRAEVVMDFSHWSQTETVVRRCLERDIPLVTGTTGWHVLRESLQAYAESLPKPRWLWASNFSSGILFLKLILRKLAQAWTDFSAWDALLIETHHRHKKDAPSGTALDLAQHFPFLKNIESLRVGEIVGEHRLLLSKRGEEIEIVHRAQDRKVYAEGALQAAEWLLKQERFVGPWEAGWERE
ncbi:MAG: hypothetical protein NZ580_03320 [Bacteroidia bacterium]|nr:hypothetical protein [Bacteroidia bacterium]MDW8235580.1 dihydrodipicolinate reductase C-terminal domain-containing protein [Bacteroidia bacterium]